MNTEKQLTTDLENQLNTLENMKRRVPTDPSNLDDEDLHKKHLAEARDAVMKSIETLIDYRINNDDTNTLLSVVSRVQDIH